MRPKFEVTVQSDEFTKAASTAFDYTFTGTSVFEGWEKPNIDKEFRIGLIIGPSGSGKTLLLHEFGKEKQIQWAKDKAIVSHFNSPQDAMNRLMAVGLNSIPSWCRPFHVLSNGEQFRANLARKIENNAVIDEFTSVIDRNVARAACNALKRYVDNNNIRGMVLASCHYDILEWLRPDWYFDTTNGILRDGRFLRRPAITLRIYPCKRSVWAVFAKYHYLNEKLNQSSRTMLATADFGLGEIPVGFVSSIAMPSGTLKRAWREHRTVVLPDFQGLGIGPRISDMFAQLHIDEGKRFFSRTAHIRFGGYRDNSPHWKPTSQYRKLRNESARRTKWGDEKGFNFDDVRICFSHEYIGIKKDLYQELDSTAPVDLYKELEL